MAMMKKVVLSPALSSLGRIGSSHAEGFFAGLDNQLIPKAAPHFDAADRLYGDLDNPVDRAADAAANFVALSSGAVIEFGYQVNRNGGPFTGGGSAQPPISNRCYAPFRVWTEQVGLVGAQCDRPGEQGVYDW